MTDDPLMQTLIHFMLWSNHTYDTPRDMAAALLKRLEHDGYRIIEIRPRGAAPDQQSKA